jgi:serine protease
MAMSDVPESSTRNGRIVRQLLLGLTWALLAAAPAASAADAPVDAMTVKWRGGGAGGASAGTGDPYQALSEALQVPFVVAGSTRDGAVRIELPTPLSIDDARSAVNRVRMLPQVLYASIKARETPADAASGAQAEDLSLRGPRVDRLIMKYRDPALSAAAERNEGIDPVRLERLAARLGQAVAQERAMSGGAWVVRLFQAVPADQARALAQSAEADPEIEYAEPDLPMRAMLVPADPRYASDQWDLQGPAVAAGGANLPAAWDITTGAAGIAVAVIDTGILPHPDLGGRHLPGFDMVSDPVVANDGNGRDADATDAGDWITTADSTSTRFSGCPVDDSSWHGTHVSGTIAAGAGNGLGIAGINWSSKVLPVRVLGKCFGYTSDIADGIVWAAGLPVAGVPANPNPARVLNLSLGGSGSCGLTFQNAINAALGAGAVIAVAAGNSNANASQFSPANCSGVITVAATQRTGARASYSNYGSVVEIAAPGGGDGNYILSTLNRGTTTPDLTAAGWIYAFYQGTSMATPHVAGIASLMLSANPALTPSQVLSRIQSTARPFPTGTGRDCTTALCGAGIIDAGAAVAAAIGGPVTVATTTSLSSSANPATAGIAVTFTASVSGSAPTGTVAFRDGGTPISGCSAVAIGGSGDTRSAVCTTSALAAGTHTIVAAYGGNATNAASTSAPLSQVIDAAPPVTTTATTTALASSDSRAAAGATVTFTATVTGSAPTGTVRFLDGGASIAGCDAVAIAGAGNARTAECATSTLAVGSHAVTARYGGDAANAGSSSSAVSVTIRKQRSAR